MLGINEQYIVCDYPDYNGKKDFELNLFGDRQRNVYPQVDLYYAHFNDLSPRLTDFIEIATCVYLADQHVVRCQGRVDEHGWLWRRRINMVIGVRDVAFWQRDDVTRLLSRLLRFLSDDCFTFRFTRITQPPPAHQQYFSFKEWEGDDGEAPSRVMLFSGGLDSLGGAIQSLLIEGRKTVLVRHKTFTNHKNQYTILERELFERSGKRAFFFTVKTGSFKKDKHEYTQRCRSFLYFALAATISHLLGLGEVDFYENGPISINLAMNPQVVGGRATRTTHPQTLFFFQSLFRLIAENEHFLVANPFWNKTKAEIVKFIVESNCGDLIKHSMSCAHTWMQDNVKLHCGVCSQCIDRRVAIIAANAEQYDNADGYKVDFFTEGVDAKTNKKVKEMENRLAETRQNDNLPEEDEDIDDGNDPYHFDEPNKNLLTSYFLRGKLIREFEGYYQFEETFPMICDALLYIPNRSPQNAGQEIYLLHKRLAEEIESVKNYATSQVFLDKFMALKRQISPDSLCGILLGIPRPAVGLLEAASIVGKEENILVKMGQMWQCRFNNGEPFFMKDYDGLEYIHTLISNPSMEFSFERLSPSPINTEITRWLDKNAVGYSEEYLQLARADKKTIRAVTEERDNILCILEDPQSIFSDEEISDLKKKLDKLNGYLKTVVGKNGEPRKTKTPYQMKRENIIKVIEKAINEMAKLKEGKEMAQHLTNQLVYTSVAHYEPITGIAWRTVNN